MRQKGLVLGLARISIPGEYFQQLAGLLSVIQACIAGGEKESSVLQA